MHMAEDRHKIQKIVEGSFDGFRALYLDALQADDAIGSPYILSRCALEGYASTDRRNG